MKTTILKLTVIMIFSASIFSSCVKDDNYSTPNLSGCTETSLVKNREVSQINAGTVVAQHQNIEVGVSDVIEAYVVSSDIAGNFFKSISFQTLDGSRAFSVPVDASSTFINYEPGRKVLIKMDGLYTDVKYGGVRIGGLFANSSGGAEVGRLPETDFRNAVQRSCTVVNDNDLVIPVTIQQSMSDVYLNKLIEFSNVEFSSTAITTTYYDPANDLGGATNHSLIDLQGNSVIFRTSAYANFASKPVAAGSGKVRGIMTKYGTDYQFVVRSEGDIKLTDARFTPLLNQGFVNGISDFTTYSVTGAQVWTYSPTFGNPNGMMKMSGFASSSSTIANDDWLISPTQDLSSLSSANLSLDNAYKFGSSPIEIKISNNYTSGDPTLATWTTLTGAAFSPGNYAYVNTGALNISAFTGAGNNNVHVAIRYTCTAVTGSSSTWEIDNVKITP